MAYHQGAILITLTFKKLLSSALSVTALLSSSVVLAQSTGLTRTVVVKADVSVPGREAIIARVDVAPGGVAGWHTHPGDEISYVEEGEAELSVAGQAPRLIKAGEGFVIPAGLVHSAKNHGTVTAKLVGVYVLEKGKPLATPAATPVP